MADLAELRSDDWQRVVAIGIFFRLGGKIDYSPNAWYCLHGSEDKWHTKVWEPPVHSWFELVDNLVRRYKEQKILLLIE